MRKKKKNGSDVKEYEYSGMYEGTAGKTGLIQVEVEPIRRSKALLYILAAFALMIVCLFLFQKLYDADRTKKSFEAAVSDDNYVYSPTSEEIIYEDGAGHVAGQLVVVSKLGVDKSDMEDLLEEYNLELVGYVELCDTYQVEANDLESEDELNKLVEQLKEEELVEEVTLNYVYKVDGEDYLPVDDWDGYTLSDSKVEAGACWAVEAINAPWLWENFDLGTVKVGVIDNMFAWDHRDLEFGTLYCNDYSDNVEGYYHGTHVAGIIGATHNNGKDSAGVLEDAEIYGIGNYGEALDGDYDWVTNLISSVALLISDDAKVINYSVGYCVPVEYAELIGSTTDEMIEAYEIVSHVVGVALQRVLDKGYDFIIACAAGNDACNAEYGSAFTAIRELDVKNRIIVVGNAMLNDGGGYAVHESSNYGERVDVLAPGTDVYSTVQGEGIFHIWADYLSGTSMASPFVAGEAAALWSFYPELNGDQIKSIVVGSADTPVEGTDIKLINLKTAFTKEFVDVSGITLDYSERVIAVDETMQLTATIMPITATATNIKWYSTDKTVASVDETGLVTALAVGETNICAKSSDGKIASCKLVVVPEVIDMVSGFVVYPNAEREVNLTINGAVGECAYLYYVCEEDADCSFSVFINDTDSVSLLVPKGSYKVYMTYGQNWYGTEYRFGDGAEYSIIDEILDYTSSKTNHNLSLKVADGNLGQSPIAENEFPD